LLVFEPSSAAVCISTPSRPLRFFPRPTACLISIIPRLQMIVRISLTLSFLLQSTPTPLYVYNPPHSQLPTLLSILLFVFKCRYNPNTPLPNYPTSNRFPTIYRCRPPTEKILSTSPSSLSRLSDTRVSDSSFDASPSRWRDFLPERDLRLRDGRKHEGRRFL
jgi:hypothetical protein